MIKKLLKLISRSIKWKLTLGFALVTVLAVILTFLTSYWAFKETLLGFYLDRGEEFTVRTVYQVRKELESRDGQMDNFEDLDEQGDLHKKLLSIFAEVSLVENVTSMSLLGKSKKSLITTGRGFSEEIIHTLYKTYKTAKLSGRVTSFELDDHLYFIVPLLMAARGGEDHLFFQETVVVEEEKIEPVGYVLVEISLLNFQNKITAAAKSLLLAITAIFLLALVLQIRITSMLLQPLKHLLLATEKVGQGDYNINLPVKQPDELGALANSFNQMARDLEQTREKILSRAEELESAYNKLSVTHSELQVAQAKLVQAGKMSALGELGAGIAHELNQPLMGIMTFATHTQKKYQSDSYINKKLEVINQQAVRMADIIDKINLFAHPQKAGQGVEEIDFNHILDNSLALVGSQFVEQCIKVLIKKKTLKVMGNANQLQQVVLNLLLNARDAIVSSSNKDNGKISIICPGQVKTQTGKEMVEYIFTDNGIDISIEQEEKLFEPFYTTKPSGKGTGLGLSISYGIMTDLGGNIFFRRGDKWSKEFVLHLLTP